METNVHAPYPNQDLVTRSPRAFLHVKTPSRSFETARPVARVSALGEGFGTPNRPPDPLDRQTRSSLTGIEEGNKPILDTLQVCGWSFEFARGMGGWVGGGMGGQCVRYGRIGGFAKVDNRFGHEKWIQWGSIGLSSCG
jgi:hypothetical protein